MTGVKLNTLLAKTDHLAGVFKKGIEENIAFFKKSQGAFRGERKTYVPRPGTIDLPKERSSKLVVTTVNEKLEYFENGAKDFINALFSQEKTNASGKAVADLIVEGKNWGSFTSLELLRLKALLEGFQLKDMYENIPVRNEDEIWRETSDELYTARSIYESELLSGVNKTTQKENYILPDPNIGKVEGSKYTPQIGQRDTVMELGDYTLQRFSGEFNHTQRANILKRRSTLLTAVIEALKNANDVVAIESNLTADKLFNYLHNGK